MNKHLSKLAVAACVTGMLGSTTSVYAATQSITANVAFDVAVTLTKNFDINFGYVQAAVAATTYALSTAGVVTPTGAGVWIGGTIVVGNITVAGSTTQMVTITTSNYVANSGVTPSAAVCKYAAMAEAACTVGSPLVSTTAPGASTTLLVGVSVAATNIAAGVAATPTFDVIVNYS